MMKLSTTGLKGALFAGLMIVGLTGCGDREPTVEAPLPIGTPCTPEDDCVEGAICFELDGVCREAESVPCAADAGGSDAVCVVLVRTRNGQRVTLNYTIK